MKSETKTQMDHKPAIGVSFELHEMLRVLTLAVSAGGDNADHRRVIITFAKQIDIMFAGKFPVIKHPLVGEIRSAVALTKRLMRWMDDYTKAGMEHNKRAANARNLAKAEELINACSGDAPLLDVGQVPKGRPKRYSKGERARRKNRLTKARKNSG